MSRMAHDFFAASPVLTLPILGMLLFAGVFLAITWRVLRTSEDEIASQASLPLEETRHD